MSSDSRFWDKLAEQYALRPIADEVAYAKKLELTRGYFKPDSNVLEFGCGTGSTAISHAPFVKQILATDISGEMIRIARSRAQAAKVENVSFEQTAFDELDAPGASFDVVLGLSILHLVDHRDPAIAKVYDLLEPGGVFVSSTVCLGDRQWYFGLIAPIGRWLGFFPILRVFTIAQLAKSVERAGFVIEYRWQPENSQSIVIVARKPAMA